MVIKLPKNGRAALGVPRIGIIVFGEIPGGRLFMGNPIAGDKSRSTRLEVSKVGVWSAAGLVLNPDHTVQCNSKLLFAESVMLAGRITLSLRLNPASLRIECADSSV